MRKLTSYLTRMFATDALILCGVTCLLLWLVNCLRQFEVVSVKGQGFGTLAVQALYTMPPLFLAFFYICIGIGMVRGLVALQNSHELHIIHTGNGISGLWRATAMLAGSAGVAVLLFAHFIDPWATRQFNDLTAEVAADLVSSTLKPNRFTQATPGVVMLIGGRRDGGQIIEFFADDRRDPQTRRTYIAETAQVVGIGDEYVIDLYNGVQQQTDANGRYSEIRFSRYQVSVESLSQPLGWINPWNDRDSVDLVSEALSTGEWHPEVVERLINRSVEGLRVVALCLFVLAIAGFPSGRRTRIRLPLEAVVLLVAFAERGIGAYSPLGSATGAMILIVFSGTVLAVRLWPRRPYAEAPA